MEPAPVPDDRRAEAGRESSDPSRRWNFIYFGVLIHLAFWIGMLWLFARIFGSDS